MSQKNTTRRSVLGALCALPFLRWIKPKPEAPETNLLDGVITHYKIGDEGMTCDTLMTVNSSAQSSNEIEELHKKLQKTAAKRGYVVFDYTVNPQGAVFRMDPEVLKGEPS